MASHGNKEYIAIIKNYPELQLWKDEHDALLAECKEVAASWDQKRKDNWAKAEAILAENNLLPEGWSKEWNTGFNDTAVYVQRPSELDDEIITKIKYAFKKAMS